MVVSRDVGKEVPREAAAAVIAAVSKAAAAEAAGKPSPARGVMSPLLDTVDPPFPPPDGGEGMRAVARWGYFPMEEGSNELMFPRGAELREVEDVNGDWFWGFYAGRGGVFPAEYVRVLG
jgi:hypothetical protein